MSTQNQNNQQTPKDQTSQTPQQTEQAKKTPGQQELTEQDQKEVEGGSGLLSGGNDLTNILEGGIGITNSSSGSDGDHSYTSNDSHKIDLGLGNMLNNENF